MKLTRRGKISYLQPQWSAEPKVTAGFSTRNGGISRAPFNSLNLGLNTEDLPANIEGNRATLTQAFGVGPQQLLAVNQVHGEDVLVIDSPNYDLRHFQQVEADAIITDQPGLMLAVLVADCFPVLFFDPLKRVIAVVHVGWRGAAADLIGKTVKALQVQFGSVPETLHAAVGPGISGHAYQVDRPVRQEFIKNGQPWEQISREQTARHWLLDLRICCELQLQNAGITQANMESVNQCTCCHKELFFSYRRDQGQTGRQAGFLLLSE